MAKSRQAGFTLIEVVITLALTGAMLMLVFVGQRDVRARLQFDGAVDRMVSTLAAVRTESTAGVNTIGTGDGTTGNCPGAGGGATYVFAGTSWTADSQAGGIATIIVDYYLAEIDASKALTGIACKFESRTISLPYDVKVNIANVATQRGYRVLYVKTSNGGLRVCGSTDVGAVADNAFGGGACVAPAAPSNILQLSDNDGHTSQIQIDRSGLAKRLN